MVTNLRSGPLIRTVAVVLGVGLGAGLAWSHFMDAKAAAPTTAVRAWARVSVDLPASQTIFPQGDGANIANAQCLICHSAGMVLRQPALTRDQWTGEINKMRNAFGAPLPADQIEPLSKYLYGINGDRASGNPSAVDGQGS
jgi:mono/diheme cytochrome c family protein